MATVLQETTASLSADFAECEKCFMCGEVCATDADLDHHVILCAKGRLRKSDSEARSSPPPPQPLTTAPIPTAAMTISTAHDEVSSLPAGSHDVSFVSDVPMLGNSLNTSVEHGTATGGGGGSNWGSPKEGGEFESPKSRRRRAHTAHGLDEESIVAERQRRRYVMEEQMLSLESLQQANQERLLRKPPQNSHHDVITTPKVASTSSSSAFTFATASRTSKAVVTGTSLDANHNSPNAYNRRHSSFASTEHHPTVDHHHGSTGGGAASSPSHHQGAGTTTYQSLARRSAQATSMERSSSAVVLPTAEGGPAPRTLPMHRDPLRSRLGASASPLPQRPPFRTTIRTTAPVAAATDDSLLPRRSSPTAVRNAVGTTGGPTGSGAARRSSTVVSRRPPSAPEPRPISTAGSPQAPHSSPNATSVAATTTTTKTVPSSASGSGLASSVRAGKVPISHKDLLSASTRLASSVGRSVRAPNLQRTAPAAPTAVAAKSTVPTSTTSATRRVVTSTPAADDVAPNRPSTIHLSSGGIVVGPTPQPQHASLRPPTKKYYSTAVLAGSNHATTGTGSSHNNYNPAPSVVSSSSNTRHVPPPPNRQQRVASRSVTEASPSTVVAVDASMAVGGAQFCAECGVKYVAHAKFCAYCGHRREETLLSVTVVESTTNPASASPSSTTLAVASSPQQLPSSEPEVSER